MNKYQELVVPNFEKVRSFLKKNGSIHGLADLLGISCDELDCFLHTRKKFARLVERAVNEYNTGRDKAVEESLYRRAVGFEQPDGKFSAPDVRAAIFWLKNRRPELWSERAPESGKASAPLFTDLEEEL